jgi:hypothetical protein
LGNLITLKLCSTATCDDHDIHILGQLSAMASKPLADTSLDPVPHHRRADLPTRSYTEPSTWQRGRAASLRVDQQNEISGCYAYAASGNPLEVFRLPEPLRPPKAFGRRNHAVNLLLAYGNDQAAASLLTAPLKDRAAPAGLHAGPKAMLPQPFDTTRLIGPLHLEPSSTLSQLSTLERSTLRRHLRI